MQMETHCRHFWKLVVTYGNTLWNNLRFSLREVMFNRRKKFVTYIVSEYESVTDG